MKCKIGDTVLYGSAGMCKIEELSEQKIGRDSIMYYVLKPIYDEKSTVLVPADNQKLLDKMKGILTKEEISEAIDLVTGSRNEWISDEAERRIFFKQAIEEGIIPDIIKALRLLYIRRAELLECGKTLRVTDEHTLKECEKILGDEVALVFELERNEATGFIISRLGI